MNTLVSPLYEGTVLNKQRLQVGKDVFFQRIELRKLNYVLREPTGVFIARRDGTSFVSEPTVHPVDQVQQLFDVGRNNRDLPYGLQEFWGQPNVPADNSDWSIRQ